MANTGVTAAAMMISMAASIAIPTIVNTIIPNMVAAVIMGRVLMAINQDLSTVLLIPQNLILRLHYLLNIQDMDPQYHVETIHLGCRSRYQTVCIFVNKTYGCQIFVRVLNINNK